MILQERDRRAISMPVFKPFLLFMLLGFIAPGVLAAEHFVPSGTSTVDCRDYSGGVKPGDVLVLAAGSRGPLTIEACAGTSRDPIIVRNDSSGSGPTVIRSTTASSGGFLFRCHSCVHVVIDGTRPWSGYPAGAYCGAPSGTNGCGIRVTSEAAGDSPSAYVKLSGTSTDVTVRGVEVDGRMDDLNTAGVGIDLNDHSITVADYPNFWRENFLFEGNYVHDVHGEGMYLGPNWREPDLRAPLRNITVRRNLVEDTGRENIQLKSAIDGTNEIYDNVARRSGRRSEDARQGAGISVVEGGSGLRIFRNWVEDAGVQGIQHYTGNIPSTQGTFRSEIFNNVVYRAGMLGGAAGNGHGITVAASDGAAPISTIVHYNTVVGSAQSGINFNSGVVDSVARDNIVAGSSGSALSLSGGGDINNLVGPVDSIGFVDESMMNFQLRVDSPAVDTGGTSGAPADDFLRTARPQGRGPDRGAYELVSQEAPPAAPDVTVE